MPIMILSPLANFGNQSLGTDNRDCFLNAHGCRLNCVGSLKVLNNVTLLAPNLSYQLKALHYSTILLKSSSYWFFYILYQPQFVLLSFFYCKSNTHNFCDSFEHWAMMHCDWWIFLLTSPCPYMWSFLAWLVQFAIWHTRRSNMILYFLFSGICTLFPWKRSSLK